MPVTLTPYKLLALILALVLTVLVSGFSGWHIRGWHDDAKQLKKTVTEISDMHTQMVGVVTASNALADTIAVKNKATEDSIAGFTNLLGDQNHALAQLRQDIKSIPVGTCRFTPDADSLYQRAYAASFGNPADPAAEAGKASVGHAGNPAAAPTRGHQ